MENQSTLTCDVTSDLMVLYATGKASTETRRSIETHLQTCTACAQAFGLELQSKKRAHLPKTSYPPELEDIFERLRYWLLPVWGFLLFVLTRIIRFLDRFLRRLGLHTTNLNIRLFRTRRKVAGRLMHHATRETNDTVTV